MYTASTRNTENLSQSALSYLQSLDKATKALRLNQTPERKTTAPAPVHESSRLSTGRGSLSLMISELRQKTRKDSTIDESDDDKSTSGRRSHLSGKTPSIESSSSTGEERIVFDFPFDSGKEDNKRIGGASHELPDLQQERKSISELRELRTSIDHSLIKPPKLQKQQNTRRRLSSTSRKESSDVPDEFEVEEQLLTPRQNVVKTKSPFRAAVESGSDIESIDFEEDLPKPKAVRFDETTKSSKKSSNTSSSCSSSSQSSLVSEPSFASKASSASSSSNSSSSSTASSSTVITSKSRTSSKSSSRSVTSQVSAAKEEEDHPSSGSSTLRDYGSDFDSISTDNNVSEADSVNEKPSPVKDTSHRDEPKNKKEARRASTRIGRLSEHGSEQNEENAPDTPPLKKMDSPKRLSSRSTPPARPHERSEKDSEQETRSIDRETKRILTRPTPKRSSSVQTTSNLTNVVKLIRSTKSTDNGTQTEEREEQHFPEFCSSNVHHVTKDVLRTHLRLLKEFNRLEWTSLQEWNAILDDIREKYDGPSTEKLKAVIEKRASHYNTK